MREAPAYRYLLNVAYSTWERSQNAQETFRLYALPLKAVPLIEVRLQTEGDGEAKMKVAGCGGRLYLAGTGNRQPCLSCCYVAVPASVRTATVDPAGIAAGKTSETAATPCRGANCRMTEAPADIPNHEPAPPPPLLYNLTDTRCTD
jgi:hypothetical protein